MSKLPKVLYAMRYDENGDRVFDKVIGPVINPEGKILYNTLRWGQVKESETVWLESYCENPTGIVKQE